MSLFFALLMGGLVLFLVVLSSCFYQKYVYYRRKYATEKRLRIECENRLETDTLTGLISDKVYVQRLEFIRERLKRALERGEQMNVVLFCLDLDGLKTINDTHGHASGDRVLKEFSNRMLFSFRPAEDLLIRSGGDEFILAAPMHGDHHQIGSGTTSYLERIQDRLNFDVTLPNKKVVSVRCSVGFVVFACRDGNIKTIADVLAIADARMYEKKRIKKQMH